ncbi:MAG: hypothetical protein HKP41_01035 [Desulfobacterales bacterium]|nr:hypothetical protein [Deltaproteobacteria bacterium]NNK92912.1 hypothetical protein [Desulfobacterales bacterium]
MMIESTVVNFGLCILIWLVQLVIYPSFEEIEESRFPQWHKRYTLRISCLVLPLMLSQVVLFGHLIYQNSFNAVSLIQGLLIFSAWVVTFTLSVPCHKKLSKKKDTYQIKRLIASNWLRTVAWTTTSILDLINLT